MTSGTRLFDAGALASRRLRVLSSELDTLVDVALEVRKAGIEQLLLVLGDLADGVDLLDTVGAELDVGGKVLDALVLVEGRVDKGGLNDVLLALGSLEERLGEAGTSHGHGEGGGTGTVLGLDDLVTAELDAVDVAVELLASQVIARLGEERNNGSARVATDDGDVLAGGVGVLELGDEARGTDDVEGGDTEEALGVVDTPGLEDLGGDGDGGVDLASQYARLALRAAVRTGLEMMRMLASGACSAAALARSRTMEALVLKRSSRVMPGLRGTPAGMTTMSAPLRASARPEGVASWPRTWARQLGAWWQRGRAAYLALGVDVANVGSDTWEPSAWVQRSRALRAIPIRVRTGGEADVVEGELGDARVELEEQRQRLANATGGTEDGDL